MWGALVFLLVSKLEKTSGIIRGLEHFTLVNSKQYVDVWKEFLICSVKLNFRENKKFLYTICSTEAATFVLQMCIKFCMAPYRKFLLCNGSSLPWHIVANAIQCSLWTVNDVTVGASWISTKHPPFCMLRYNPDRVEQGVTYVVMSLFDDFCDIIDGPKCPKCIMYEKADVSYIWHFIRVDCQNHLILNALFIALGMDVKNWKYSQRGILTEKNMLTLSMDIEYFVTKPVHTDRPVPNIKSFNKVTKTKNLWLSYKKPKY